LKTPDESIEPARQLAKAGKLAEAEALCRKILAAQPDHPGALNLLGTIARRTRHHDDALQLIERAISLRPAEGEFHRNLGRTLGVMGSRSEARDALRKSMELSWSSFDELSAVGDTLLDLDLAPEALEVFQRCVKLRPTDAGAQLGLGTSLLELGQFHQALRQYDEVLRLDPDNAAAHSNIGHILLTLGDFARGWPEFEWRWRMPERQPLLRKLSKPMWKGEPLNGRRIFIFSEVGIGETINFVRYIPLVAERGGKVIFSCQKELRSLLANYPGVEHLVEPSQTPPEYDLFCGMVSLPAVFQTNLQTIPPIGPPFAIDPAAIERWKTRLAGDARLKVGLVWSGNPRHPQNPPRSVRLAELAPLAQERVRLISLQKNEAAAEIGPSGLPIEDWTAELTDFADTAALAANLDLIVSVDTAVAHLAAAMGRPVWTLMRGDWRWQLDGSDTPWYPTMRLFRQKRLWDWSGPIADAAEALRRL